MLHIRIPMCMCIYIYTYVHTYIHTYVQILHFITLYDITSWHYIVTLHYTTHIQRYKDTYMHACMHACVHGVHGVHTYTHTYIHTYMRVITSIKTIRSTTLLTSWGRTCRSLWGAECWKQR